MYSNGVREVEFQSFVPGDALIHIIDNKLHIRLIEVTLVILNLYFSH